MPFSIRKVGKNKYQVYNTATGEIHSKGTTKKKAEGQFRLLQGIHRKELIGNLEGGVGHQRANREAERLEAQVYALEQQEHRVIRMIHSLYANRTAKINAGTFDERQQQQFARAMDELNATSAQIAHRIHTTMTGLLHAIPTADENIEQDMLNALAEDDTGAGRMRGGWNFSNRNYNPLTVGYNALFNGATENYRNNITKEGVRQDIDRNIADTKKFLKNPNPLAFAKDEAQDQFSRYGSGYPANPSDYQPRRFL
jgi:hypothetical protein